MSITRVTVAASVAAAAALALPITAQAATKTVDAGLPVKYQQTFQNKYGADVNAFFPRTVAVHVGDTVKFAPVGFHSVNFPARGGNPLPLLEATGAKVANVNDAAGAPFWFNGQDVLGFNALLLRPFGAKVTYNGSKEVNSGVPAQQRETPFFVKFTKAGTYTYFCNVHAGMKATVRVLAKRKKIPSKKADAKAVKTQVAAALKVAKTLPSTKPPAGTIDVGAGGRGGVSFFGFLPATTTVPVGTTLTFRMATASLDVHTATIGPGDPEKDPSSYLGQLAASFQGTAPPSPIAVYPSDAPGAVPGVSPTSHGNGFWNSGVMDTSSATTPPGSASVRFAAPGTYQMYCVIHPFMHATITVQ